MKRRSPKKLTAEQVRNAIRACAPTTKTGTASLSLVSGDQDANLRLDRNKACASTSKKPMLITRACAPGGPDNDKVNRNAAKRSKHWKGGSDATWRSIRKERLRIDPNCACGEPAVEVDHVVPLARGGQKYSISNTASMCHSCHSAKTAKELGKRPRPTIDARTGMPTKNHWWCGDE